MKGIFKKSLAAVLAVMLTAVFIPAFSYADEGVKTASVIIRAQASGYYIAGGIGTEVEVPSDKAESYGYIDNIKGDVSALDALVYEHEVIFGESFTPETKNDYLVASDAGWVSTIFGEQTYSNGFMLNGGYPNDGTASQYGGYNGTTVNTQKISDGDVLDFYIYTDIETCTDTYAWITDIQRDTKGETAKFKIKAVGNMAMGGYLYKTPGEFKAAANAESVESAQLAFINEETGEAVPIADSTLDENGEVSIDAPDDYYIAVCSDADGDIPIIMNPIHVENGHVWEKNLTIDKEPTYTATGSKSIHCSLCGEKKPGSIVSIAKLTTKAPTVKAPKIKKITRAKKSFTVKWTKKSCSGYEIKYSGKRNMSKYKIITVKNSKTVSKKVRNLRKNKTYYVKVRAYKDKYGKRYYSKWSGKKIIRTR